MGGPVELAEDVGDGADAAAVAREVLEDGSHQLLVLLEDAGEKRGGVEHCDLAGVHEPR